VLYLEGYTTPTKIDRDEARKYILEDLHEKKQRVAMQKEFDRLQDNSQIDNFLAGTIRSPKGQIPARYPVSQTRADQS